MDRGGGKSQIDIHTIFSVVNFFWKNIQYFQWWNFLENMQYFYCSGEKQILFKNPPPPNMGGGGIAVFHGLKKKVPTVLGSGVKNFWSLKIRCFDHKNFTKRKSFVLPLTLNQGSWSPPKNSHISNSVCLFPTDIFKILVQIFSHGKIENERFRLMG